MRRPSIKMGISSGPMTSNNFSNIPFSKTRFWEGKDFLVQSAAQKWSSLQKMILSTRWSFWQEMSHFHFSPWKRSKGGTIGAFFFAVKPYDFDSFSLVSRLFSTEYDYSTSTNQHICPPAQIRLRSSITSASFPWL